MHIAPQHIDAFLRQKRHQFACSKAGTMGVPFVQAMLNRDLRLPCGTWLIIQAATRHGQQIGLPEQRHSMAFFAFDQGQALVKRQVRDQIFFSASSPAS